jgi:hypothetical protein
MANFGIDSNLVFDADGKSVATRLSDHDTSLDGLTTDLADIAKIGVNVLHPPSPLVGAKGDGSTDDTTVIQNIINSYNGIPIIFPYATYLISSHLNVSARTHLIGFYSTIKLTASADYVLNVVLTSLDNVRIEGLNFDANNLNTGNGVALFSGCKPLNIKNCKFINSKTNGIWVFNNNQNVNIENNRFDNSLYNGILVEGNSSQAAAIDEINLIIKNNIITNSMQQNGIFVAHGLKKIIIEGNIVKYCGDEGIEVGGSQGTYGTKEVVISNNIVEQVGQYQSYQSAGILIYRSDGVTGSNNKVKSGYHGLQVKNSTNVKLDVISETSTGTIVNIDNSDTIKVFMESNNTVTNNILINASKHCDVEIKDTSSVSQTITHTHAFDQNNDLVDNRLKLNSKVAPTLGTINWGLYYNFYSDDGYFDSNRYDSNAFVNSKFIGNSLQHWVSDANLTASASSGQVTLTSTANFAAFSETLNNFASMYPNQFLFSFDYQTANADAYFEVFSTDGTNTQAIYSQILTANSSGFASVRKKFQVSPLYPNLKVRFMPRTSGGTGNLVIKNLRFFMPTATELLGAVDKQLL